MNDKPNNPNSNATSSAGESSDPRYHNARFMLGIVGSHLFCHEAAADQANANELDFIYDRLVETVGYLGGVASGDNQRDDVEAMLRDPTRLGSLLEQKLSGYLDTDPDKIVPPGRGYSLVDYQHDLGQLEERMSEFAEEGTAAADARDYESAATIFTDLVNLGEFYEDLEGEDYDSAINTIDDLDTAMRDEIPKRLYDHLMQEDNPGS